MNEVEESIRFRLADEPVTQLEELVDVILSAVWRAAARMCIRHIDFIGQRVAIPKVTAPGNRGLSGKP